MIDQLFCRHLLGKNRPNGSYVDININKAKQANDGSLSNESNLTFQLNHSYSSWMHDEEHERRHCDTYVLHIADIHSMDI